MPSAAVLVRIWKVRTASKPTPGSATSIRLSWLTRAASGISVRQASAK